MQQAPVRLYKNMIQDHKDNGTSYAQCQSFNLDEYVGIDRNHPESYWTFMHENLFKGIDLPEDKIHVPYGSTKEDCEGYEKAMENVSVDVQVLEEDSEKACADYNEIIRSVGGIDIQLLGIGGNGHIGFNEPGTPFTEETHIVELTEKTRSDNARFFDNDINQVPTHAITMGIATIMKAKKILLVASGANKADAVAAMVNGPVDPACPASVLQNHEDVVVVVDEAAAAKLAK